MEGVGLALPISSSANDWSLNPVPWIGQQPLERLHMGTLQPWIAYRRKEGARPGTINHGLKVVRRILNLAAAEWIDERGMTWLQTAPKIKLPAG